MKKYLLFACCLATISYTLVAQDQFGLKICPGLAYNRIYTNPDTAEFSTDGLGFSMKIGPIYDHAIKEHYYVSTGLFFALTSVSIKNKKFNIREKHALQYLQVPILLKFYTSEIALDTKLSAELGPVVSVLMNDRVTKLTADDYFIKKFRWPDLGGLLGLNVEYNLSLFTSVFAGLSYQWGFNSILKKQDESLYSRSVYVYSDYISINLGMKF